MILKSYDFLPCVFLDLTIRDAQTAIGTNSEKSASVQTSVLSPSRKREGDGKELQELNQVSTDIP